MLNCNTPWKYTKDINNLQTLFSGEILPYVVDGYVCSCGHIEFVIKNVGDEIDYECLECSNTLFHNSNYYNTNQALYKNTENELDNIIQEIADYSVITAKDAMYIKYGYNLPVDMDMVSQKIYWEYKEIYGIGITNYGKVVKTTSIDDDKKTFDSLSFKLLEAIKTTNYENFCSFYDKLENLKQVSFFLKNRHLADYEFLKWDGAEYLEGNTLNVEKALEMILDGTTKKSIKKALYQNYYKQIQDDGKFNFLFAYIIIQSIDDENLVVRFLNLDFHKIRIDNIYQDVKSFINFLTHYYSQKQIISMFEKLDFKYDSLMFYDTIRDFQLIMYDTTNFTKVKCKLFDIHYEIVKLSSRIYFEQIKNVELCYSKQEISKCIDIQNYNIKLPLSGDELFEWGSSLHNCLAGYCNMILNKDTLIYGFFRENKIEFAVEIKNNNIIQASSYANSKLNDKQQDILVCWEMMLII